MSWDDFSIAISEMLNKEQYGYNPTKKVYTKMIGGAAVVVDILNEEVYFFDGSDKSIEDTGDVLAGIRDKIVELVGAQVVKPDELPVKNDIEEHIKETETQKANEALGPISPANVPAVREPMQAHTSIVSDHIIKSGVPTDLSVATIKKYINDKATDEEAYVFLQLCLARNLNPFLKEAYLIKYNHTAPASFVVGKDAFMKRAELHGMFDGFEAGIIVESNDEHYVVVDENRVGTFIRSNETLLGGWAKVYRKDRSHHTEITVSLAEFNTGKSSWEKMPATMIRKVALVNALREAFPSELSGMYDSSEVGVEP